jgi:hypothetical protein
MKSFLKAVFWLLVSVFYGLLPLGIIFFQQLFDTSIVFTVDGVLKEGILIFFCVALSSSVMVDYIFTPKKLPKWIEFVMYGYPWILVSMASLVYSQSVITQSGDSINWNILIGLQFFIMLLTVIYTLIVKSIIFQSLKLAY